MFKTIESEVLKQRISPELRAEFLQHDFERLHGLSLLVFCVSIGMWFLFDLIVSFQVNQGFSVGSLVFLATLCTITLASAKVRKATHFYAINLLFVTVFCVAARLVIEGLPGTVRSTWLVIVAATILYSATAMPLSRPAFFSVLLVAWVLLNPLLGDVPHFEGRRSMLICYPLFISALSIYIFHHLSEAKLHNYAMARLLVDQAYLDVLTGLPNRRSFMARVGRRLSEDESEERYLAMADIDHFKRVNDSYGHDVGDDVLIRVAQTIRSEMDGFEFARLGGEEFGLYLCGISAEEAGQHMERLRHGVAEQPGSPPVTISIGLARLGTNGSLSKALIKADQALYEAKHNGRNRVSYSP